MWLVCVQILLIMQIQRPDGLCRNEKYADAAGYILHKIKQMIDKLLFKWLSTTANRQPAILNAVNLEIY